MRFSLSHSFGLLVCLLLWPVAQAAAAPVGYAQSTVDLSSVAGFRGAAALAYDPAGNLYVAEGNDFLNPVNQSRVLRVDTLGNVSLFTTLTGDDAATVSIGGLAVHPGRNSLLVTDQADDARTLYELDLGTGAKTSHVATLSLQYIDDVAVRADGAIVVSVAEAGGQIHQVDPAAMTSTLLATTAGYTGGVAFDSAGDLLYIESVTADFINFTGDVYRLAIDDTNPVWSVESTELLAGDLTAAFDLVLDGEDDLFVTGGGGLFELPAGTPPLTASLFDSQFYSGEIAFLAGVNPFAPFAGPNGGVLAYIPDYNSMTISLFTPTALATAGVPEPSTLLLGLGGVLAGAAWSRRRKITRKQASKCEQEK